MDFIVNNWYILFAAAALIAVAVYFARRFYKLPSEEQLIKVREWLLYATTVAEKELGGGTGKLKLRYVYDLFITKFPWVAQVLPFLRFSELVDEALEQTRAMLENNVAVQNYVNGPAATTTEKEE